MIPTPHDKPLPVWVTQVAAYVLLVGLLEMRRRGTDVPWYLIGALFPIAFNRMLTPKKGT